MGLMGIWVGIALANTIGSIIVFAWVRKYYNGLIRDSEEEIKHPVTEVAE